MNIHQALAVAKADAAKICHFIETRERFLDALDWSLLSEADARESTMLDELLAGDAAEASLYTDWLAQRAAARTGTVAGVLRFAPAPRPWQPAWITIAA